MQAHENHHLTVSQITIASLFFRSVTTSDAISQLACIITQLPNLVKCQLQLSGYGANNDFTMMFALWGDYFERNVRKAEEAGEHQARGI